MQDMTPGICYNAPLKQTIPLVDKRDRSAYEITKLDDGNCWMTQNLRLVNKNISSVDSDMTSGSFTVKSSTAPSGWTSTSDTADYVYYNNSTTNGAYYTWYTATAGTNLSSDGDATKSICPKGWRLPTRQEYKDLLSKAGIGDNSAGATKIKGSPYNFVMGGWISSSGLSVVGSQGDYWSSTAYSNDSSGAYSLWFSSSRVSTSYNTRYRGNSIRCIAK